MGNRIPHPPYSIHDTRYFFCYTPAMKPHDQIQKTALTVTRWVGSPASIIVHTLLFAGSFFAVFTWWLHFDRMLLILTTIVSLEAIYLAIFIQMTINFTTQELAEVSEDIEEMTEEEASEEVLEEQRKTEQKNTLVTIQADLRKLMNDISKLQQPKQ